MCAVAAGGAGGEDAIFITEADGEAIDLGLDDPFEGFTGQQLLEALDEIAKLVVGVM